MVASSWAPGKREVGKVVVAILARDGGRQCGGGGDAGGESEKEDAYTWAI